MTRNLAAPPQVGDQIVIGAWYQYKSVVSFLDIENSNIRIYVTITYPEDDSFFKQKTETVKVWLHDEGDTWHRINNCPSLN